MIRWLVSLWRGPLCDAGTGHGARPGCLKTAVHTTVAHPVGWSRGFRWCEEHKDAAGQAVFGAWGAVRSTPAPTDAQVLDADAELAALVRRAEVAEADAARLRAESEERRRGIEVTEDALHAAQAEVERLRKFEPHLVEAHIREAEATARVKAPFARDFALTMAALLTEHGAPNYIETKVIHDTIGEIAVTVQRCAGKTPHEFRREAEEQRDAALAQLAEWRESVVAANRISQAFEERALRAEADRDGWKETRMAADEHASQMGEALALCRGRVDAARAELGRLQTAARALLALIGPGPTGITPDVRGTYNQRVAALLACLPAGLDQEPTT